MWYCCLIVIIFACGNVIGEQKNLNSKCKRSRNLFSGNLKETAQTYNFNVTMRKITKNTFFNCFSVKYLSPGVKYEYESNQTFMYFRPDLRIYCYRGSEKLLSSIFQSALIRVHIENDDFVQYEGQTAEIVNEQYENQRSIFSFNVLNTKKNRLIKLDPFNQTCVGIETAHNYTIELNLIRIDFWKVILLCIATFVFISATKLSQTPLFYYLTGICLGIFASVLIIVYMTSKLLPRVIEMHSLLSLHIYRN